MKDLKKIKELINNKNFNKLLSKLLILITSSIIISSFFYLMHTISPTLGFINIIKSILSITTITATYIITKDIYIIAKENKKSDILDNQNEYNEIQKEKPYKKEIVTNNNQVEYKNTTNITNTKPKSKILKKEKKKEE